MKRPLFRRMVCIRFFGQGGDAIVQVAMASYVLFNPQSQASGPAIAAVLAITMLPFAFVGPFLSPVLDSHSRQRAAIVADSIRVLACAAMALAVAGGHTAGRGQILLMVLLLIALSLNRFQLAAMSAALPFTIESDEYVEAAGLMPVIGPASALIAGAIAGGTRLVLAGRWPANWADGLLFCLAGAYFVGAIAVSITVSRTQFGPLKRHRTQSASQILSGLIGASRHIASRLPASLTLTAVFVSRTIWGALIVVAILVNRHHFYPGDEPAQQAKAMLGMGLWFGLAGVGSALCGALVTPLSHKIGIRKTVVLLLLGGAAAEIPPLVSFNLLTLVIGGFMLGLFSQSIKICTDTVVQTHVDDGYRGRVMVVYDILNNTAIVVGAVIAAFTLPAHGLSVPVVAGSGAAFAVMAIIFALASRNDPLTYDRGTKRAATIRPASS